MVKIGRQKTRPNTLVSPAGGKGLVSAQKFHPAEGDFSNNTFCGLRLRDAPRLMGKKHYSGDFCSAPGCETSSGKDKYRGEKRSYFRYPPSDQKRLKSGSAPT